MKDAATDAVWASKQGQAPRSDWGGHALDVVFGDFHIAVDFGIDQVCIFIINMVVGQSFGNAGVGRNLVDEIGFYFVFQFLEIGVGHTFSFCFFNFV